MPYMKPPVQGAPELPFQNQGGWDATNEGQISAAEQSSPEHAFDATEGSGWSWDRWRKTVDGGQADMNTGEPTGAGWAPDGSSDASRWKEV